MQNYYLIDFENVREAGLEGAIGLDSDSHIYLFYTDNANRLGLDAIAGIDAEFRAVKVVAGRQSLDMHLISFLGYIIGKAQDECCCTIISNDKGFDGTIAFWNASGLAKCARRARISTAPVEKPVNADKQPAKAKPERRDRQRRNERKVSARSGKQTAVIESDIPAAEEAGAEEIVAEEASVPEIIAEEPVIAKTSVEIPPEQEDQPEEPSPAEAAEITEKSEETAPAVPRKKTHRGGRGRGKKAARSENGEENAPAVIAEPAPEVPAEAVPASEPEQVSEAKPKPAVNPKIFENLRAASVDEEIIDSIGKIVISCADKKNVKQAVYREIIRRYGQKQGLEYYGIIKKNV